MIKQDDTIPFSIIIPIWPYEIRPFGLDYVDNIDWPKDNYEVILSRGLGPCKQRNEAAKIAQGDILVFLDNDSCPQPQYLHRLFSIFSNPDIAGAGGPNPGLVTDKFIPRLVDAVFTSFFVVGSKKARYMPTGELREGGDSDFIFCNFAIRKNIYLELGGLDERLCPNEENEFFERFKKQFSCKKLIYDPLLIAYEPRPDTILFFLRKMFGYGRGRARQFKIRPSLWSMIHMFGILAFLLPFVLFFRWGIALISPVIVLYLTLVIASAVNCYVRIRDMFMAELFLFIVPAVHFSYILGLWKGLFESTKEPKNKGNKITLEYYSSPHK